VLTYGQALFLALDTRLPLNGFVYAAAYILAALATLLPARLETSPAPLQVPPVSLLACSV
jgi:hypothetical protein